MHTGGSGPVTDPGEPEQPDRGQDRSDDQCPREARGALECAAAIDPDALELASVRQALDELDAQVKAVSGVASPRIDQASVGGRKRKGKRS